MKMVFTIINAQGKHYTSQIKDHIDDWNTGLRFAITYARKMSEIIEEPVKLDAIQRINTNDSWYDFKDESGEPQ